MIKKRIVSKAQSFDAWEIFSFIKGRKKMVITVLGTILGYAGTGNAAIALVTGPILEAVFATAEFWFKERTK